MKAFNQFINEGIRNKMIPKSKEELDIGLKNYLNNLKKSSEDKYDDAVSEDLRYVLENIYEDRKKLINDLMYEGLDPNDLLVMITDDLSMADNDRQYDYRLLVQKWMYNLIEKNKDKIDLSDL